MTSVLETDVLTLDCVQAPVSDSFRRARQSEAEKGISRILRTVVCIILTDTNATYRGC